MSSKIASRPAAREPGAAHPPTPAPAGLGVSTYRTIVHFAPSVSLARRANGIANCERVTTSAQSYTVGIPAAMLGLAFFVARTALSLPAAWHAADRWVHLVRLATVPAMLGWSDVGARAR